MVPYRLGGILVPVRLDVNFLVDRLVLRYGLVYQGHIGREEP